MAERTYLEFFAGGGMARAGLGESWRCLFANDFDQMKVETYEANWGTGDIKYRDVASLSLSDLPAGLRSISHGLHFPARTFPSLEAIVGWVGSATKSRPDPVRFGPFGN